MPPLGSARTITRPTISTAWPDLLSQWPSGMGFDYFYGFLGGETDQWTPISVPQCHANLSVARPTQLQPDHWHGGQRHPVPQTVERGGTRQAVLALLRSRWDPRTHQPTPEWIKKTSDMHLFDQGWEKLRETIFANQKRLGVVRQIPSSRRGRMASPNTAAQS